MTSSILTGNIYINDNVFKGLHAMLWARCIQIMGRLRVINAMFAVPDINARSTAPD